MWSDNPQRREQRGIHSVRLAHADGYRVGRGERQLTRVKGPRCVLGDCPDGELSAHNPFVIKAVSLPSRHRATLFTKARFDRNTKTRGVVVVARSDGYRECTLKDKRELCGDGCLEPRNVVGVFAGALRNLGDRKP